ncbi:DUF1064 domain-containing protein [Liquorilactobacillus satsumensis]|uniref:DUF1064 domain-containing protein n=1 Tax=Liquorilactobacillus TaxID=2767888 RepID=UPI0021C347DC|nr:DUF1064 domain-containing protein [Liquorilactobacillus satsumensis]MCP9313828.1 DUF1064 domain-containing protein [Liquorilactobacillus satsumensis]MCP9360969.1 DUF1064 domain-containing protein [Liquorilactobacillus satsumensis]
MKKANKPGTHFGKKVQIDGFKFDSKREAQFYLTFVRECPYRFDVQRSFTLQDNFTVGGLKMRRTDYRADFVIYNEDNTLRHVIDIKNGFSPFAVDQKSRLKFKFFAARYNLPVEVIVPRKHDFRLQILGLTTKFEEKHFSNFDYTVFDLIGG